MAKTQNIYLQKQRFTVTSGHNIEVEFELDEQHITIFNERGGTDFKFKNSNTLEILNYWEDLFKCMLLIIDFAKRELDKPRSVTLLSKNPKGPAQAKTQGVRGRKAKAKSR